MNIFKRQKTTTMVKNKELVKIQGNYAMVLTIDSFLPILSLNGVNKTDIDNFDEQMKEIVKGERGRFMNGVLYDNGKKYETFDTNKAKTLSLMTNEATINTLIREQLEKGYILSITPESFIKLNDKGVLETIC